MSGDEAWPELAPRELVVRLLRPRRERRGLEVALGGAWEDREVAVSLAAEWAEREVCPDENAGIGNCFGGYVCIFQRGITSFGPCLQTVLWWEYICLFQTRFAGFDSARVQVYDGEYICVFHEIAGLALPVRLWWGIHLSILEDRWP